MARPDGPGAIRRARPVGVRRGLAVLRRFRIFAIVAAVALVLTSVSGASAAPGPGSDPALAAIAAQSAAAAGPGCSGTQGQPYATGLPPIPYCYFTAGGPNRYQDYGGVLKTANQDALRPKVSVTFQNVVLRTFYVVCYFTASPPPCPVDIAFPRFDASVTPYYVGLSTDVWVQSAIGADPQYGDFPTVRVNGMAFGSIPITADVSVRQVRDDSGMPVPMQLTWVQSGGVQPGKEIPGYEKYGVAPVYNGGADQTYFTPPPDISGRIVVSISNVTLDKVPLDVGPACQTETTLKLTAAGGFYNSTLAPKEGEPGEYAPVNNGFPTAPQYLHGSVDIPAFSGCMDGDQDISNLITGTVSGQGNPVEVVADGALKNFGCLKQQVTGCENQHPPYYDPPGPGN